MTVATAPKKNSILSDPILALQVGLAIYACYATWGLNVIDGSVGRMLAIFNADVPVLTGTDVPVKTHFTGFPPLDNWIVFMIVFFWEALNGSHPSLVIEGLYFFGQVTAMWTLMCLEGNRNGNKGLVVAKFVTPYTYNIMSKLTDLVRSESQCGSTSPTT
jgi:hypothetical protein